MKPHVFAWNPKYSPPDQKWIAPAAHYEMKLEYILKAGLNDFFQVKNVVRLELFQKIKANK
jgi:hypothetical protein